MQRRDRFRFFWLAQGLSAGGDAFSLIAVPLLVLRETGSVLQMGLLTGLTSVGVVVAGALAGIVVDRVDRRKLMVLCDAVRAVLYGLVPLLWLSSPQVWTLYLIVPFAAFFGTTFHVAYVTAVPNLVEKDHITQANGRLEATYAAMTLAGIVAAGIVSAAFGPVTAIAIDAASFAVSALCLLAIRIDNRAQASALAPAIAMSRAEFLAGARFLWDTPILRALTILLSLQTFIMLGLIDVFIFYLKNDLGESDRSVGYVLAAATIGSMLAGGLVATARRTLGFGWCWIGAYTICGLAIASVGFTRNVIAVAAIAVVFLFCTGIAGTCSMSLRQEITPDHLLGRVTSAFWTIHNAIGPIGAAMITAAVGRFSVTSVCLVAGACSAAIALSGMFTEVGRFGAERGAQKNSNPRA